MTLRDRLEQFVVSKQNIQLNFPASAGGKLVSASGTIKEVADDHLLMVDIYGNSMIVPMANITYIEAKK